MAVLSEKLVAFTGLKSNTTRTVFTATEGQDTFAVEYDVDNVDVYLNGIKLIDSVDFTASNGTSVVLSSPATLNDSVDIVAYGTFDLPNFYNKTESDARYATESYVGTSVAGLVDAAPATLDTLNELAAALGDDPNFATTVTNSIATKLPLAGGTLSGALDVTGTITADGIALGDNAKATFGASDDLQIYHDGNRSYINGGTTELRLQTSELRMVNSDNNEIGLKAVEDGAVTLYYNGADKLSTTNSGVAVTGTVKADGLTVDTAVDTSGITITTPYGVAGEQYAALRWNNSSFAGGDSEIRNVVDGTTSVGSSLEFHTEQTGTGVLTERLKLHNNGDISFYEDTGTTAKFFWDASAESLGIGTTATGSNKLHIEPTDGQVALFSGLTGGTNNPYLRISHSESGGYSKIDAQGSTIAGSNLVFSTINTERMRIDSSGNVGIGTSSPSCPFSVDVDTTGLTSRIYNTNADGQGLLIRAGSTSSATRAFQVASENDTKIMTVYSNGNVGIGTTSPSEKLTVTGNILASGNITAYSDKRVKENIEKIPDALAKVKQLNGYTFDRTDQEMPRQTGVIAQEVLEVLPEAVMGSEDDRYTVAYGNMVGLLIEAIKEQQAQIDELKETINGLTN
jgi:hypothetical protein